MRRPSDNQQLGAVKVDGQSQQWSYRSQSWPDSIRACVIFDIVTIIIAILVIESAHNYISAYRPLSSECAILTCVIKACRPKCGNSVLVVINEVELLSMKWSRVIYR